MARNSPSDDDVKSLMNTGYDGGFTVFIRSAKLIVDEDLAESGLTDARKNEIELFLAAHFATLSLEKGGIRSIDSGNTEQEFKFTQGAGYTQTRYGQQAMVLDTSGTLMKNAIPMQKAEFRVVKKAS